MALSSQNRSLEHPRPAAITDLLEGNAEDVQDLSTIDAFSKFLQLKTPCIYPGEQNMWRKTIVSEVP